MMKTLCDILKSIPKVTRRIIQLRPRTTESLETGDHQDLPNITEGLRLPVGRASHEPLPLLLVGICFAAASVALQALQTKEPLPPRFCWFCMVLQFSFVAFMVSIYIRQLSELAAIVLEHAGVFFGATAFVLAITMCLPFSFVLISVTLYIFSILIIIIGNLYKVFANHRQQE